MRGDYSGMAYWEPATHQGQNWRRKSDRD